MAKIGKNDRSIRSFKPYAGGFVLSRNDLGQVAHFSKVKLPSGDWFYSDSAVDEEMSSSGTDFVVIRGHWALTTAEAHNRQVSELLLSALREGRTAFETLLDYLAGRYLIITCVNGELHVYHDMVGARSVYYSGYNHVAGSHLKLVADLVGAKAVDGDRRMRNLLWAADYTPYDGIWMLLPNHLLCWKDLATARYFPRQANDAFHLSSDEKFSEIERIWRSAQRQYFRKFPSMAFSVSGGIDSRLVLAMAKPIWGEVEGYTYGEHFRNASKNEDTVRNMAFFRRTMVNDDRIVRQLLETVSLKSHTFIDTRHKAKVSDELQLLLDRNTWGFHGQHLVASYMGIFNGGPWLNVRGNTLELSRNVYEDISFEALVRKCQQGVQGNVRSRLEALDYDRDLHGYSRLMMAHWELKDGKWLSEIHNELDPAFDTWIPAGIRRLRDLLAAFSPEEREQGLIMRELIDRNAPELNWPSVNGEDNLYQQWRDLKTNALVPIPESVHLLASDGRKSALRAHCVVGIPARAVAPGAKVVARLVTSTTEGVCVGRILKPYRNAKAAGYFTWSICLNGKPVLSGDAARNQPEIDFLIEGVQEGDSVSLEIEFHKSVQNREGWASATRMQIHSVNIYRLLSGVRVSEM